MRPSSRSTPVTPRICGARTRTSPSCKRDEAVRIPDDFDYAALPSLSAEVRQKLARHRPATIAQAGRIEGMTPAALLTLLARLKAVRDGRPPERKQRLMAWPRIDNPE